MSYAWPQSAKIMKQGFALSRENVVRRTEMDAGAPKQVRYKTRILKKQKFTVGMESLADYNEFINFMNSVGGDWFDFPELISLTTVKARFVYDEAGDEIPQDERMESWQKTVTVEYY